MSRADERSTLRSPKPDGFATKSSLRNKRPGLSGRPLCKGVAIGPRGEGPTERYYFVVGRHLLSFRLFAFFLLSFRLIISEPGWTSQKRASWGLA